MTFTPDPAGLDEILANSRSTLTGLAQDIVAEAQAEGPRNPSHARHVIDTIRVGGFRVEAGEAQQDIDWTDGRWHFIEFGSATQPPARLLTRAAQNHGLNVTDRGKH